MRPAGALLMLEFYILGELAHFLEHFIADGHIITFYIKYKNKYNSYEDEKKLEVVFREGRSIRASIDELEKIIKLGENENE